MFNTVESLDTLPKLLHFFHTLEQLGFFYLEARCFVRGFVYLLDIPKFLDGIFLVLLGNIIPVLGKRGHTAYLLRLPRQRHGFILGSAYLNRGLAQSGDNTHILGAGIHNLMNRIVWNLER